MRSLPRSSRLFSRSLSWLTPTLLLAMPLAACGDDNADQDQDSDTAQGDGVDSTDTPIDPWASPTVESDNWYALHLERGRLSHNQYELDFYRINADGSGRLGSASFPGLAEAGLNCKQGCITSPDGRYLAVATTVGLQGTNYKVGTLDKNQAFQVIAGAEFTEVSTLKLAGDYAFYTQSGNCTNNCTYSFKRTSLTGSVTTESLGSFPITSQEQSLYQGNFTVSANGKTAVALTPTIHGTRLNFWRDGQGFSESEDICRIEDAAGCTGAGSEYTDSDPLAIDASGRYVALFTTQGPQQIVRAYDLSSNRHWDTTIVSVSSQSYSAGVCQAGQLAPWQWSRVVGSPAFSADASELFFLAEKHCPVNGSTPSKSQIDIMRLKTATVLNDAPLLEEEVFNVTKHPQGDVVANQRPIAFAISPDGATLVFAGTSTQDSSGSALGDGSSRSRSDRELYRIGVNGENRRILYNDNEYAADLPVLVTR